MGSHRSDQCNVGPDRWLWVSLCYLRVPPTQTPKASCASADPHSPGRGHTVAVGSPGPAAAAHGHTAEHAAPTQASKQMNRGGRCVRNVGAWFPGFRIPEVSVIREARSLPGVPLPGFLLTREPLPGG